MISLKCYTDGSCPVPHKEGGWGFVVIDPDGRTVERNGYDFKTTNQRMELTAPIKFLELVVKANESLKRKIQKVIIISDSKYVIDGFTKWSKNWIKNGWVNSSGDPVANVDLWQYICRFKEYDFDIEFVWVKGHSGDKFNDIADRLACEGTQTARQLIEKENSK